MVIIVCLLGGSVWLLKRAIEIFGDDIIWSVTSAVAVVCVLAVMVGFVFASIHECNQYAKEYDSGRLRPIVEA